jgi:peptide chain release factor subunit 1
MEPSEDFKKIMPKELVPVTDIDVRELAEIYEETDVYLSIYLPTASREEEALNETYINGRLRSVKKAVSGELQTTFDRTFDMVKDHISHRPIIGEKGRIIFASYPVGLFHIYRIGVVPERKMILDTSPFLLPLARLRDDYEDYAILLMDSQQAVLFSVRSDVMKVEGSDSIDLMNRHKKGGMSQMRFNRLRRGAIHSFISDVVEDIQGLEELSKLRGLVLAGPGEAKKNLYESLPQDIRSKVIGIEDLSMDTPMGELLTVGDRVAIKDERAQERAHVEILRTAIMKGQPAAYGAQKVKIALNEGRVNVLLLMRGHSIPGWICERCQNIRERVAPPEKCTFCGGPTSGVDVVEELYELAQRTGAEVDFVEESDFLTSIGGIGAILRY